ncbi:BON domain-containing protein [Xenorhabdus bovienii]|uniref:BON domain-containing protein n=1 Tax=Xenorhabdus bovienii TaxID=40576 RepID=UPI001EE043E0|nr:BON domain-containing protein [Xenorhabdus bovienii]MCG3460770.1 BON domain-containing protein [Xenorhabdus bovienii]
MKHIKFTHSLLAIVLGSVLISSNALAALTSPASTLESVSSKVDNSLKHADAYVSDSSITAQVKADLLKTKGLDSNDISVKTEKGVVYLSGFVKNTYQAKKVAKIVHKVHGVKSVKNTLKVKK